MPKKREDEWWFDAIRRHAHHTETSILDCRVATCREAVVRRMLGEESLQLAEDAQRAEKAVQAGKRKARAAKQPGIDDLVVAILQGEYDAQLELLLEATHHRKRMLRSVPQLRRRHLSA